MTGLLRKILDKTVRSAGRVATVPVRNAAEATEALATLGGGAARYNRFGNISKPGKAREFQLAHPEERTWLNYAEGVGNTRKAIAAVPMHLTNMLNGIESLVHPRVTKVYNSRLGDLGRFASDLAKDAVVTSVPAVGLNILAPETGAVMDMLYDVDDPSKTLSNIPADYKTIRGIKYLDEQGNPLKTYDGKDIVFRPNGTLKPSKLPWLSGVTSAFNKINNNRWLNPGYAFSKAVFDNQFHPYNSLYGATYTASAYSDHIKDRLKSMPRSVDAGELNNLLNDKTRLANYLMSDAKTKSMWFPNAEYFGANKAKEAVRTELEKKLGEMMDSSDFLQLRNKIVSNKENGLLDTDMAQNMINRYLDDKFYDIDNEIRKGVYDNLKKSKPQYWSTSPIDMDAYIRKGTVDGHKFYEESKKNPSE